MQNQVAVHLSRLDRNLEVHILNREFPDEFVYLVNSNQTTPWYAFIFNYLVSSTAPAHISKTQ